MNTKPIFAGLIVPVAVKRHIEIHTFESKEQNVDHKLLLEQLETIFLEPN